MMSACTWQARAIVKDCLRLGPNNDISALTQATKKKT